MAEITEVLENEANRLDKLIKSKELVKAQEEDGYDGFTDTNLKLIPTPNFTDAKSVGTMLPINLANETVTNISRYAEQFDLVDFVKEKLNYTSRIKVTEAFSSEQIDALVLAIKSFEKDNAFILGDMAGIGKGRICAGIMRYAIQQNLTPIFITHKPYLFSDIYRDVTKTGNFGSKGGKPIFCTPFIMNANDPEEASIKTKGRDGRSVTIFPTMKPSQVRRLCEGLKIPKTFETRERDYNFNCVFLTYSQISHTRINVKQNFLEAIAPKSILIFDESHNAASANESSRIMKRALPLVEKAKGILFSSATYAKRPEVFGLYVVRTALRSAISNLASVTDALKVGGENVSEYIATGLCYEGQMIRRERSFGDCKKETSFVNENLEDDKQQEIYNEAISYFKQLRDFTGTDLYADAALSAIQRKVADMNLQLVLPGSYEDAKNGSESTQRVFIQANQGKWVLFFEKNSINRYKATFRENLFYAIKAKWTAEQVLKCLNTPVDYKNVDGSTHRAPMKPLIAIRNTGESLFNELELEVGQEIDNDFSEYLRVVAKKIFKGNFKLRKVNQFIFDSEKEMIEVLSSRDTDFNLSDYLIKEKYEIQANDFADGGVRISQIQSRLEVYRADLPLSSIDTIREMITSTQRPALYYVDGDRTQPKYGNAGYPEYTFAEATGRKSRLNYNPVTQKWVYSRIEKTPITDIFIAFNSGQVDVMMLNVTASTGGSAQSSPDEGIDTRPRNMFIVQFEGDINVEVQKRGRVNRTGQLNSPTYTYIITDIPAERRTYLMFRKKLRKLDANTSANQTASSETAELTDKNDEVIEDIFNKYGYEVFMADFINEPEYAPYKSVFDNLDTRFSSRGEEAEKAEANVNEFEAFVKELELYPAARPKDAPRDQPYREVNQEDFFNIMNEKYRQEIQKLIANGEYQLELKTRPFKAFLKQRVPVKINSGETVFSMPLFMADYFTLEDNKAWSKERIDQKAQELAKTPDGKPMELGKYWKYLLDDYDIESRKSLEYLLARHKEKEPVRDDFSTDEEFSTAVELFNQKEREIIEVERLKSVEMRDLMLFFRPMTKIVYVKNGQHLGYFVGYKIREKGRFRYTPGNVEFIFCCLTGFSIIGLKASNAYDELKSIKLNSQKMFGGAQQRVEKLDERDKELINKYLLYDYYGTESAKKLIEEWKPKYDARIVRRFYSGNILSGIVQANRDRYNSDETGLSSWNLIRFSNVDGSVTTAVELRYGRPISSKIPVESTVLAVSSGSTDFIGYVERYSVSNEKTTIPLWNVYNESGVCERGLCVINYGNIITVQVMQPYKWNRDSGEISEYGDKSERYNALYHDVDFIRQYRAYYTGVPRLRQTISYAKKYVTRKNKYGETLTEEKYKDYKTHIITFNFDIRTQRDVLRRFFYQLGEQYDLQFNFRPALEPDWLVEDRGEFGDVPREQYAGRDKVKKEIFETGEYQYRFIKPVNQAFVESIPNMISFDMADGPYGTVTLSLPIKPTECASYGLKPFRTPLDVLIKMTFSQLKEEDKTYFANKLEEMANAGTTPLQMGLFVDTYLKEKAVSPIYFFGDIKTPDIGRIFTEYALKNDLNKLVIEEEVEIERKPRKTKVEYFDAERFIIRMLQ